MLSRQKREDIVPKYQPLTDLRREIRVADLAQADVADEMGIHESTLSRYLTGRQPAPEGFAERVRDAISRLVKRSAA